MKQKNKNKLSYCIDSQNKPLLLSTSRINMGIKFKFLVCFLLIASTVVMGQRKFDPQTLELIKTKKIAFLTDQLALTSKEAEKFWPVYNDLEKQRFVLMDQKRELEHTCEEPKSDMKEGDYRKLATDLAASHAKEGKLIEEYNLKFLNILPAEKVVKLYLAEGKFRATLMREFRKNQQEKKEEEVIK
jgi:hypothetical protein